MVGVLHAGDTLETRRRVEATFHDRPVEADAGALECTLDAHELFLEDVAPLEQFAPDTLGTAGVDEGELEHLAEHVRGAVEVALDGHEAAAEVRVGDDGEVDAGTASTGLHDAGHHGGVGGHPLADRPLPGVRQTGRGAKQRAVRAQPREEGVHVVGVDAETVLVDDAGDVRHPVGTVGEARRVDRVAEHQAADAGVGRAGIIQHLRRQQAAGADDGVEAARAEGVLDDVGVGAPGLDRDGDHRHPLDPALLELREHEGEQGLEGHEGDRPPTVGDRDVVPHLEAEHRVEERLDAGDEAGVAANVSIRDVEGGVEETGSHHALDDDHRLGVARELGGGVERGQHLAHRVAGVAVADAALDDGEPLFGEGVFEDGATVLERGGHAVDGGHLGAADGGIRHQRELEDAAVVVQGRCGEGKVHGGLRIGVGCHGLSVSVLCHPSYCY